MMSVKSQVQVPDWSRCSCTRAQFVDIVNEQGSVLYRDLPWRKTQDAYAVLVSEVMLQQTQVKRVLDFWPRFLALFPTVDALASADTATVLDMWQGLGYNRRALALQRACSVCAHHYGGQLPFAYDDLLVLPGIGPATAAGVRAFAYNAPGVYLETNVRSVFLHHLFACEDKVSDKVLEPYIADTCPPHDARRWYYALLDYGAHLKATGINPSRRSAHHVKQSTFKGSHREKRSFVLRTVLAAEEGIPVQDVRQRLSDFEQQQGRDAVDSAAVSELVDELVTEGFFAQEGDVLRA